MEAVVKEEFGQFLTKSISAESLSSVDDIVLGYIVNVLEQLGEDQEFDVDDFVEIMAAYIPGFDTVSRESVYSWMLGLAEKLVKARTSSNLTDEDNVSITEDNYHCSPSSLEGDVLPGGDAVKEDPTGNSLVLSSLEKLRINSHFHESSTVTVSSHSRDNKQETDISELNVERESTGNNKSYSEEVLVLAEMFPEASSLEIKNCLMVSNGDVESAVQLMLLKKENIDDEGKENYPQVMDLSPKVHAHCPSSKRQELQEAEQQNLKEQMMARYGYVEVGQEEKTHQPTVREQGEKKLVRYRNNQVVSTRGERFSYVKQEEPEEMKKTYVNIKPARKYRFH